MVSSGVDGNGVNGCGVEGSGQVCACVEWMGVESEVHYTT